MFFIDRGYKRALFSRGINYNDLPAWQKRGIGFWYEEYDKEGYNPLTEEKVQTKRKRVHVLYFYLVSL